ncbi:MAG: ethanolamine utilization protein EutJ [Anaerolineales bacterium]|nr:ethanolamine utilization protein EutJ [Anaerolineales bacterium]
MVSANTPIRVPDIEALLSNAQQVILRSDDSGSVDQLENGSQGQIYTGVDLGTAYLVLIVLDEQMQPLAGEYQFAEVVRDGLVLDFFGTVERLQGMKARVERRLGRPLNQAGSAFPPGVPDVEVRVISNVLEAAGLECVHMVDEPSAANAVLKLDHGAIVDVGGGTTGIALVEDGAITYTADEPTGGTHFSLVVAGALDITYEEAEAKKTNPEEQARLLPTVRPVMEKVGSIVNRHLANHQVMQLALVGGSAAFPGFAGVLEEYTGIPTWVPSRPLFVTPLGIAMNAKLS